jgi:hypothetical protein
MKLSVIHLILLGMILCACTAASPTVITEATLIASVTATQTVLPSSTPLPSQTATQTVTPQPTNTLTPTAIPVPTDIPLHDPLIQEIESQGYVVALEAENSSHQLLVEDQEGHTYIYSQYVSPAAGNCYLVFFNYADGESNLLQAYDVSQLNQRMVDLFDPTTNSYYPPSVFCTAYGWGDVNQNGKPDLAVDLMWANQINGSELHIFEINAGTVVNLTENIDGIFSPWKFDPTKTEQQVVAIEWAKHDCLHPPLMVTWIYDWDAESDQYVNVSSEGIAEEYFESLKAQVTNWYGGDFYPFELISPIVTLLVTRDGLGQREQGWAEFRELTNLDNWPEINEFALEWLQSDVAHFTAEYNQGKPFTPNDFCEGNE